MGKRERVIWLLSLTVVLMYCDSQCSVALPHDAMVGMWCVIVVFPDYTRLLSFPDQLKIPKMLQKNDKCVLHDSLHSLS